MASSEPQDAPPHRIVFRLDEALLQRGMTLTELSRRTGITMANLSTLKNNRGKAIRFTTLTMICDALQIEPAQLFAITELDGQLDQSEGGT
ncbi:helix-turn-helix domain-containing protein [Nesterenkonia sp. CF4.4]|uniref:helix-turn-helix domain-containing protein n=1 Tax=Nesterenkonia sp. CF4.4 TaxID=3373079 RepID=UPI003EE7757B